MQPKASIIVPTFNGENKIAVLLTALQRQTFQEFEMIVVIDGSTDNTLKMVSSTENNFSKVVISQPNLGRAATRNNGAKLANGKFLIFFDDDMEPAPNCVEKHIAFHERNSGILTGNQIETEAISKPDIQNYKAFLTGKWIQKYREGLTELNQSNLFFTAASCSFKQEDFIALNGFDERLTDAEDFDIAHRALESGIKVFFDKSNRAIHHDAITCSSYIYRLRQYQQAHAKLKTWHPERNVLKPGNASIIKRLIYHLFAFSFWPRVVDNHNFLLVLPKKFRYKIYSTLIHALAIEFRDVKIS